MPRASSGTSRQSGATRTSFTSWRTFLVNHAGTLACIDFLTVPTATFRVFYVFLVLSVDRRKVVHWNVTSGASAEWTAQQIVEAFAEDTAPRYLLRGHDGVYGAAFSKRITGLGIEEVRTAPHSPWQNPFVERLVGSIRRDCLDHVIVLGEAHLRAILRSYFAYYHRARTHLSLGKDAPEPRPVHQPSACASPKYICLVQREVSCRGVPVLCPSYRSL